MFRTSHTGYCSRVVTEMELIRELNEGIPRVFKEMKDAGLPEPKIVETAEKLRLSCITERLQTLLTILQTTTYQKTCL